jgi:drug/metabolite transporter (DMT)-like permease
MFLFKARVSRREIFFVITAFAGLYLLSGFSAEFSYGDILILLCAVAFAFEIVLISHFSRIKSPIYLAFGQVLTVAILSTPLSIVAYRFELSRDVAVALLITAVFATTLARIAQNHAQKFTRSTDAAIIFSMEGVFSHILAIFMLGESLTFTEYAGAGLIVLSVIGISLSESTQKKIPQDTQKLK